MTPTEMRSIPETPWARPWKEIAGALRVSVADGLADREAKSRRKQYGPNRLRRAKPASAWTILAEQFESLLVALLAVAAVLSLAFGEWVEGAAILAVILINAAIGFVTELRAVRSMEALQHMGSVEAKTRRDSRVRRIPAEKLVPGDVVVLEGGGRRIGRPASCRSLQASGRRVGANRRVGAG